MGYCELNIEGDCSMDFLSLTNDARFVSFC